MFQFYGTTWYDNNHNNVTEVIHVSELIENRLETENTNERTGELHIREAIQYILDHYQEARLSLFENHKMGNHVRSIFKDIIIDEANLNQDHLYIKGSVGNGRWAEIPWISIFNRDITTTATKGYYIVYLFKADMSGVYISLNQGWTYFKEKYQTKLGRKKSGRLQI